MLCLVLLQLISQVKWDWLCWTYVLIFNWLSSLVELIYSYKGSRHFVLLLFNLSNLYLLLSLEYCKLQKEEATVISLSICSTIMWGCFRDIMSNQAYQKSGSRSLGGCKYILSAQNFSERWWRLALFTQHRISYGWHLTTSVTSKDLHPYVCMIVQSFS